MSQELVWDSKTQSAKDLAWWLYIGHGLCLVFSLGMLSVVPLIINYVKRGDARDTFVHSHHRWQIRTFWWFLFWMCVVGLLWITFLGIPVALLVWTVAWIWKAYRLICGFFALRDDRPMPV